MLIEVSQPLLWMAVQKVTSANVSTSAIPILSGIKLEADRRSLTLTAGTVGMIVRYELPLKLHDITVIQSGSIVVPSRYFSDIVRYLPVGSVRLEVQNNLTVSVQAGQAQFRISGMKSDLYPRLAAGSDCPTFSLPNDHLKQLIKRVSFAVSNSEARPALTGIYCRIDREQLHFVATDGIRLSSQTTTRFMSKSPAECAAIIPGKNLSHYCKMLHDESEVTDISIGDHGIEFKTKHILLQSSIIVGNYPSISHVVSQYSTTEVQIETSTLLHALERVVVLSGDKQLVTMRLHTDRNIELSSHLDDIGHVAETIPHLRICGESVTVSFNGRFMLDILRTISSGEITITLSGRWNPIRIQPTDNPASFYIITPIRTH